MACILLRSFVIKHGFSSYHQGNKMFVHFLYSFITLATNVRHQIYL